MRFLFRLDLSLHAGTRIFFFEILNYATKQRVRLIDQPTTLLDDKKTNETSTTREPAPSFNLALHAIINIRIKSLKPYRFKEYMCIHNKSCKLGE